ncbi:MAG: threonine synthase [Dehalococcoidia bacterium]|nr:threonine synthase [Dehalococcoidia bacterium]MDW8120020.1 threonine synthase [Chloroflexota bacterium]
MPFVRALQCRECKRQYPIQPLHVCEFCFGPLEVVYDYPAIARVVSRERIQKGPLTMWRYQDLLPVDGEHAVDMQTGFTPLLKAPNLGRLLGLDHLYLKNDAVNPSYSFKDRVVGVASTKAREFGFDTLACASTGNLAGSVAAHAARAGMKAFIFIPADLEQGKVIGTAVYGPTLVAVKGSYDDVNKLCAELADTYHWAFVNINMRPYYAEGSKTLAFEVVEQLGWRLPDHCIIPVASGSLLTKVWKGLHEFVDLGLVAGPVHTRIHAAQAEGCSPVVQSFHAGHTHVRPVRPQTIAKSLAIGNPADGVYALRVLRASGGTAVAVPEEEVAQGITLLAETEGIFTETAGGVVISALKRLAQQGVIRRDEVVVAYITGNGLKTQEVVAGVARPLVVEPTVASFQRALNGR